MIFVLARDRMGFRRGRRAGYRFFGCYSRCGSPWHGSIRTCLMRHGRFGALRCGLAYSGWICCSDLVRLGRINARIVIGGVVLVIVVVNLVGIAARNFLDRLVFLFQLSHVAFECGFEFALSAAKLGDRFSDRLSQFRQFLGAEKDQGDQEDNDHLLHTDGTHGTTSRYDDSKPRASVSGYNGPIMTVRGLSFLLLAPLVGWAATDKIDIDL